MGNNGLSDKQSSCGMIERNKNLQKKELINEKNQLILNVKKIFEKPKKIIKKQLFILMKLASNVEKKLRKIKKN